ncbi:MAG TPA: zinc ribbon domain-containing protein [Chitinispirillaceae bacterium]|nr:zinc ribbon domain-containing protein [Chitinispirillaceae bacterium]
MPMYEFLCSNCNVIFTFFSRSINTSSTPLCPKCHNDTLSRMVSQFAYTGKAKGSDESAGDDPMSSLNLDESKMEHAMEALASEAESINEDDPRQAANLMRKLTSMTGLKLGDKMEEALSKMEAGADPDEIEQQMGDIDENDLFKAGGSKGTGHKKRPSRDEKIYDM